MTCLMLLLFLGWFNVAYVSETHQFPSQFFVKTLPQLLPEHGDELIVYQGISHIMDVTEVNFLWCVDRCLKRNCYMFW